MQVLQHVETTRTHPGKCLGEADGLMVRQVTAILDYQIDVAMQCPQHVSDAIAITLIGANVTDPRSDRPFSLRRQDVHTDDVRRRKQASQPTDRSHP